MRVRTHTYTHTHARTYISTLVLTKYVQAWHCTYTDTLRVQTSQRPPTHTHTTRARAHIHTHTHTPGICFTIEKPNPFPGKFGFHEIWHLFVIFGAASHWYVLKAGKAVSRLGTKDLRLVAFPRWFAAPADSFPAYTTHTHKLSTCGFIYPLTEVFHDKSFWQFITPKHILQGPYVFFRVALACKGTIVTDHPLIDDPRLCGR